MEYWDLHIRQGIFLLNNLYLPQRPRLVLHSGIEELAQCLTIGVRVNIYTPWHFVKTKSGNYLTLAQNITPPYPCGRRSLLCGGRTTYQPPIWWALFGAVQQRPPLVREDISGKNNFQIPATSFPPFSLGTVRFFMESQTLRLVGFG